MINWKWIEAAAWPALAFAAAYLPSVASAHPEWPIMGAVGAAVAAFVAYQRTNPRNATVMADQSRTIDVLATRLDRAVAASDMVKK